MLVRLLPLACVLLARAAPSSAAVNEFEGPDWTQLPAGTIYNTTPSCPLTEADYYQCNVSSPPPADTSNPERYLNSAYWPAEKRPDVEMWAIQKYGYDYQNCQAKLPHYCFLLDAQAVGYPVTHTPQVGDLWLAPGECLAWGGPEGALRSGCTDEVNDWYLGYVEQVFPDGSFIQSWGGSESATDSGLAESWFSGAMDPYTEFIGLMPPGTPTPVITVNGNQGEEHGPAEPGPTAYCTVPRLRQMTLSQARRALQRARCRLGHVWRPRHLTRHRVLRVTRQSAPAKSRHPTGYRVSLRLH